MSEIIKKTRKPRKNQIDRKSVYLETSEVLFAKKGYETTTIKDIAIAAKASMGLLFNYFPKGKEDILVEIIKKRGPLSLSFMEELLSSEGSFEEILLKYGLFQLEYSYQHKNTQKILLSQSIFNDKILQDWRKMQQERRLSPLQKFIEEKKSIGEISPYIDSKLASEFIFNTIFQISFIQHIIMNEDKERCIQHIKIATSMFSKQYTNSDQSID